MDASAQGRRLSRVPGNPTVGVKSDFERLLTNFTDTKSVRYEEFVKIWKSMQMSLIFSGRRTDQEAREFTEDCFNIALTFLMPPYNFQVRVGALYVLYGLYWKQPCRPITRIRVTPDQWKELTALMVEVKEQQHLDVEYVFTVLEYHRAFTFTATSIPMYPNMRDVVDNDTKLLKADAMAMLAEQKSILSEILEPDNIDQLSAIHENYHRLKCLLNDEGKAEPKASLNVIKPSLVQYITKSVAAYEEKRKVITGRKARKRHDSRDSGQTTTSESEAESDVDHPASPSKKQKRLYVKKELTTGDRRAQIKAKAMAVNTTSKGRRGRKSLKESSSEGFTSPSFSSPSPKRPRKSPKSQKQHSSKHTHTDLDLVDTSDISPWGAELRANLLSMPMIAESEPNTKKNKKMKKSLQGVKRLRKQQKDAAKNATSASDEPITPGSNKNLKKAKTSGKKKIKSEFASPESLLSTSGNEFTTPGSAKKARKLGGIKGTTPESVTTLSSDAGGDNEMSTPSSVKTVNEDVIVGSKTTTTISKKGKGPGKKTGKKGGKGEGDWDVIKTPG